MHTYGHKPLTWQNQIIPPCGVTWLSLLQRFFAATYNFNTLHKKHMYFLIFLFISKHHHCKLIFHMICSFAAIFKLNVKKYFSERVVSCWNGLPMEVVGSLFQFCPHCPPQDYFSETECPFVVGLHAMPFLYIPHFNLNQIGITSEHTEVVCRYELKLQDSLLQNCRYTWAHRF